jgi:FtsH-binding integral membrane protein
MKNYNLISKVTLWTLMLFGIFATAIFFLGGNEAEGYEVAGDILNVPVFTNLFLGTNYAYFFLAVLATLCFVCLGFVSMFKQDSKKAMFSLGVVVAFVLLFVVCWFIGSPDKLDIIGYEGTDNQGFWAQLSDMMMYVCYALVCGVICSIVWGAVYTRIKK